MLKLKIQTTRTVTTDDLRLYCDPPLTFGAVGHIPTTVNNALLDWADKGYDSTRAVEFVPRLFSSVAQNGTSYPLASKEDAAALREAVGDVFLRDLVEGFWNYDYRFFHLKRLVSENSLPDLTTTNGSEPTP